MMARNVNRYGALPLRGKFTARLARWVEKRWRIFPVPGLNTFLVQGFRPYGKGLQLTESPRHANVLLVAFPLSEKLEKAAAVIYAQMPRPRSLVFINGRKTTFLPEPDLKVNWTEINMLRSLLKEIHPISDKIADFRPSFLEKALNEEDEDDESEENRDDHDHKDHHHHEEDDKNDEKENSEGEGNEDEHDHGYGGGMDFMSMVAMTKGQPAGKDGLIMDRNETYFGPFHSGLPDGLCVKMTIDGDTVVGAEIDKEFFKLENLHHFPKNPLQLPDYLADCFPQESGTFRHLAQFALLNSGEKENFPNPILLEKERILNHLLWLITLMQACGDRGLVFRSFQTLQDYLQKKETFGEKFQKLHKKINRRWYLKGRLQRLAVIPENLVHHFTGPLARAAGLKTDWRLNSPSCPDFEPVVLKENNAWGHLQVRLAEIAQSLDILQQSEAENFGSPPTLKAELFSKNQTGAASIETANGKVRLRVEIEDQNIKNIRLSTPSVASAALLPAILTDIEVADAIVTISSLGISPFKTTRV